MAGHAGPVTGLVLAGGEGRRMGGVDKGLLLLGGQPLVARVAARLRPQVDKLLLSANRNLDGYRRLGFEPLVDTVDDGARTAGPLAGVLAGLDACATDWIVTAPCDSPELPDDLVNRLLGGAEASGARAALATTDGGAHPVFMLLRRELAADLRDFLEGGGRRIRDWQNRVDAVTVHFPDDAAFANINTPDDLARRHRDHPHPP
ncbi:MAG: molybdenum cofactor guanylyltransferase [Betaproteobacteria bacterium]|nr:molybdenum cofactor guanylyltransferase [Betaproteobacteria bacterium]